MINYYRNISFLILGFITLLIANPVNAAESGEVGFNIQMIPVENQATTDRSYFDLRMLPGQEQTINVRINNTSNEKSTFDIQVNQAYTNEQGFIDYQDAKEVEKNTYPVAISDLLTYEKSVSVNAHASVDVPIMIHMPEKKFDGQMLAGIQVNKHQESDKTTQQIINSYGYILGLKLTETDVSVSRKVELIDVQPEAKFGQPSIVATVKNPTMDAIGHLVYEAKIVEKETTKEVFKKKYDAGMELAPNSIYPFAIEYGKQRLEAGNYTLHLTVSDAKENRWIFDKDFEITIKEANAINQVTIDQGKEAPFPWIFIVGGIIVIFVLLRFYYWKKKKNSTEEQSKDTEKE